MNAVWSAYIDGPIPTFSPPIVHEKFRNELARFVVWKIVPSEAISALCARAILESAGEYFKPQRLACSRALLISQPMRTSDAVGRKVVAAPAEEAAAAEPTKRVETRRTKTTMRRPLNLTTHSSMSRVPSRAHQGIGFFGGSAALVLIDGWARGFASRRPQRFAVVGTVLAYRESEFRR